MVGKKPHRECTVVGAVSAISADCCKRLCVMEIIRLNDKPRSNRASLIKVIIAANSGAAADVPSVITMWFLRKTTKLCPIKATSGYPRLCCVANEGAADRF